MVSSNFFSSKLTINLDVIQSNYKLLKKAIFPAEAMCVVKANAYGLGAVEVTKTLLKAGAKIFFVATLKEALELRKHIREDFSLYVLEGLCEQTLPFMLERKIFPVINTVKQLKIAHRFFQAERVPIKAMLYYETGMSRLGLDDRDIDFLDKNKQYFEGISIQYVISHLACADKDHPLNERQGEKMRTLQKRWPDFKYSLIASKGIWLRDKYLFDGGRFGFSLYMPEKLKSDINLQQSVTLEGRVLQIREVPAGAIVGYGGTFITKRPSRIAVLGIGFADGYMRSCSNATKVAFKGELFPVVGRICMDLSMVDVTLSVEGDLKEGDWMEIIGPNISVHSFPVSPYELLVRFSSRPERVYIENNKQKPKTYCAEIYR